MTTPNLSLVDVWDAPPGAPTDAQIQDSADSDLVTAMPHVFHEVATWAVDSDGAAEWAMARLSAAQEERSALEAQAAEWARRIQTWFTKAAGPLDRTISFFSAHLEAYALRERARTGGKRKSVALPSGKIGTVERGPKVTVTDEAKVIAWAKSHLAGPDRIAVVKQSESVLLTGLRQVVVLHEVPTRVVFSPCGCVHDLPPWDDQPAGAGLGWTVGSGMGCPVCGDYALVARWDETTIVARDHDGLPVPGVEADMGDVTAKVTPL